MPPPVDTLLVSMKTIESVESPLANYIPAKAKLTAQIEIQDHGRQSWNPMDLAAGGS
jgi:hypothetical protein